MNFLPVHISHSFTIFNLVESIIRTGDNSPVIAGVLFFTTAERKCETKTKDNFFQNSDLENKNTIKWQ